ncbi:YycH protein [Enterococcus faecalis 13-SD-W-01]|nr:YycH protein [Enterococcus faecalis 13-SD-W-01]
MVGMRISEKVVRIGLIAMIILSLYFSYVIWLSPASKKTIDVDESNSQMISDTQSNRSTSEIFLPLRVTQHKGGKIQETNSENLITRLQNHITQARFGKLTETVSGDQNAFNERLDITDGFELSYVAPFLISEYKTAFDLGIDLSGLPKEGTAEYFTRVQFDEKENKLRFFNFAHHTIYEANLVLDWTTIKKEMDTGNNKWIAMSQTDSLLKRQYDTEKSVKLKKYSYILSQQPYTLFRNSFFQSPDEVMNNDESNELVFYGNNESLTIKSETQEVDFGGTLPQDEIGKDFYSETSAYISRLGSALGNLRYFDRENTQIDYRIFIEGFPVFGTENKGKVRVAVENESKVNIQTSLNTIQVPIPSDEEVELPSTSDIIQQLIDKGAKKEAIHSVVIGYTWQNIKETNRVVDLLPEWYVKYNNNWFSANELLDKLPEMEAE